MQAQPLLLLGAPWTQLCASVEFRRVIVFPASPEKKAPEIGASPRWGCHGGRLAISQAFSHYLDDPGIGERAQGLPPERWQFRSWLADLGR